MATESFDTEDYRIPVTVLTGFLGSGKTTLLNYWVKQDSLKNTAVLINEFGPVGLDHVLVNKLDDNVVLLDSGCICCSIQGDLVKALQDLFMRATRKEIPPFTRVFIETTGLADPSPVMYTLRKDPFFAQRYRFDGTVTVVDTCHIQKQLEQQYEAVKQVALADILVLTKTDLAEFGLIPEIQQLLKRINPMASQHLVRDGKLSPSVLSDIGPFGSGTQRNHQEIKTWLLGSIAELKLASPFQPAPSNMFDNNPLSLQAQIPPVHQGIMTFSVAYHQPIQTARFLEGMRHIQMRYGERLLRFKGILWLEEDDRAIVAHGVHNQLYPIVTLDNWPYDSPRSELVFIMKATEETETEVKNMLKTIFFSEETGIY